LRLRDLWVSSHNVMLYQYSFVSGDDEWDDDEDKTDDEDMDADDDDMDLDMGDSDDGDEW